MPYISYIATMVYSSIAILVLAMIVSLYDYHLSRKNVDIDAPGHFGRLSLRVIVAGFAVATEWLVYDFSFSDVVFRMLYLGSLSWVYFDLFLYTLKNLKPNYMPTEAEEGDPKGEALTDRIFGQNGNLQLFTKLVLLLGFSIRSTGIEFGVFITSLSFIIIVILQKRRTNV